MRIYTAFLLIVISGVMLHASEYYQVDEIGSSATAIGIGYVKGLQKGAYSVFENPALLTSDIRGGFSIFYTQFDNDVAYSNITLYGTVPKIGIFGLGVMQVGVDGLITSAEDNNGEFIQTGVFEYLNRMVKVSYTLPRPIINRDNLVLNAGVVGSYYRSKIASISGTGTDIDVGTYMRFYNQHFSFMVKNALQRNVSYSNNGKESLSRHFVLGHKATFLDDRLASYIQVSFLRDNQFLPSAGLQYTPSIFRYLRYSFGIRSYNMHYKEVSYNGTFGVSLVLDNTLFHYAIEKSDSVLLNYKHYFSFEQQFVFGDS